MFGMVCYRETGGEAPPVRVIRGVRFRTVYLLHGTGLRARLSRRAALRALAREDVRRAVFLVDTEEQAYFAQRGVAAVSAVPLRCATAAAIARRYMEQQGVAPRCATVALAAERVTPELRRAVLSLAPDVRYLTLAVPSGGEELARTLRRRLGIAARLAAPGEPLCADLTLCFGSCDAAGAVLALCDPALTVEYDDELPDTLLAALWQAGALDAAKLAVRSVEPKK